MQVSCHTTCVARVCFTDSPCLCPCHWPHGHRTAESKLAVEWPCNGIRGFSVSGGCGCAGQQGTAKPLTRAQSNHLRVKEWTKVSRVASIFRTLFTGLTVFYPGYKRPVCSKKCLVSLHGRHHHGMQNVDIFSKDFLLIPIHGDLHWSLVIVCYPGLDLKDADKQPYIVHLDSMKGTFAALRACSRQQE